DRTGPEDRIFLILLVLPLRQRLDPADPPVFPGQADEFAVVVDNIDEIAGNPGRLRSADVAVPDPAAPAQVDSCQEAAVADRDDQIAIDHGATADIGQSRESVAALQPGEVLVPEHATGLRTQSVKLSRAIRRDDRVA